MAKLLKLRRGSTSQHSSFTGAEGEVTVDTDKDVLVVNDGSTAGGHPLAAEDMSNVSSASIAGRLATDSIATTKIAAGALPTDVTVADANISGNLTIANADVNSDAAIAGTKVSPDFGAQNIVTTGTLGSGNIEISGTLPVLSFTDTNNNPDYQVQNNDGTFIIRDTVNNADRFRVNTDGHVDIGGNLDCGAGIDVTGDILGSAKIGKDAGDYITFTTDTQMDVYVNGSNEFRFEADGDFHADGDVIAFSSTTASDRKLKENIEVIPNALDKVHSLNGVSFDWKKTGEKSAGVIAQEVQGVLPEAVKEVTSLKTGESHLTVNYHALTSILIEAIKELTAEIEELKEGL